MSLLCKPPVPGASAVSRIQSKIAEAATTGTFTPDEMAAFLRKKDGIPEPSTLRAVQAGMNVYWK